MGPRRLSFFRKQTLLIRPSPQMFRLSANVLWTGPRTHISFSHIAFSQAEIFSLPCRLSAFWKAFLLRSRRIIAWVSSRKIWVWPGSPALAGIVQVASQHEQHGSLQMLPASARTQKAESKPSLDRRCCVSRGQQDSRGARSLLTKTIVRRRAAGHVRSQPMYARRALTAREIIFCFVLGSKDEAGL